MSEELLSQARAALKLEDYDGAIRLAKQAAQELAARLLGQSVSDSASVITLPFNLEPKPIYKPPYITFG